MPIKNQLNRIQGFLQSKNSLTNQKTILLTTIILLFWLAVVIFTESRHEFWRDEIRALTLVQEAGNPLDLIKLIRYEGHPLLWYLLLYIGKSLINTQLILPITSILIAFAAVSIFMFYSPFPLWFRTLFIFNAFPLYEYSVMARNYGITMLLLFIAATLYRKRRQHPFLLAFVLALMANTNVHAVILSGLIAVIWVWDFLTEKRETPLKIPWRTLILPMLIILAGIVLCIFVILPPKDSILIRANQSHTLRELLLTLFNAVFRPDITFDKIMPEAFPSLGIVFLFLASAFGLLRKPLLMLAALAGQTVMGLTFLLAYSGKYRHQGLFLIFLVGLYWLFNVAKEKQSQHKIINLIYKAGFLSLTILIIGNIFTVKTTVISDIKIAASASKQFGNFLNQSETFRDAIILPEPDYMMESLPYYSNNSIYLPREDRFGKTTSWSNEAGTFLTLGDLLTTARKLKSQYNKPVLIAIGHWDINFDEADEIHYSYNKIFAWNENDVADFKQSTEFVTEFSPAFTGEKYRVYELK
jgi:hypothetical protein